MAKTLVGLATRIATKIAAYTYAFLSISFWDFLKEDQGVVDMNLTILI